jgi:hypothetical protein
VPLSAVPETAQRPVWVWGTTNCAQMACVDVRVIPKHAFACPRLLPILTHPEYAAKKAEGEIHRWYNKLPTDTIWSHFHQPSTPPPPPSSRSVSNSPRFTQTESSLPYSQDSACATWMQLHNTTHPCLRPTPDWSSWQLQDRSKKCKILLRNS